MPDRWSHGPEFLRRHRHNWSVEVPSSVGAELSDPEVKKVVCNVQVMEEVKEHPLDKLIAHYSDFYRLKKAVAWMVRWVRCMRDAETKNDSGLSVDELKEAECSLLKRAQEVCYREEIHSLVSGDSISRSSHILSLDPVLSHGMLVVGGRLKHAPMRHAALHPAILPRNHMLSRMILIEAHRRAHLGAEWLLSVVRRRFWIPGARQLLQGIRRRCVTCLRLYGKSRSQKMADLPPERCTPGPLCFQHVGVDLFGPFFVVQGRSSVKRYGCVFTCLSVRAIHIEVLNSLETDSFINGFRRFCARRGNPRTVKSDRGTNLVGASVELAAEFKRVDKTKVVNADRQMEVEWSFNPPTASHQGGVWERMIRKVLMAVIPCRQITDDVLSTVFCEVENLVNGRPLTKCSSDVLDEAALTPNHLLLLEGNCPPAWRPFCGGEAAEVEERHDELPSW